MTMLKFLSEKGIDKFDDDGLPGIRRAHGAVEQLIVRIHPNIRGGGVLAFTVMRNERQARPPADGVVSVRCLTHTHTQKKTRK